MDNKMAVDKKVTLTLVLRRFRHISCIPQWRLRLSIQLEGEQFPTAYVVWGRTRKETLVEGMAYANLRLGAAFTPAGAK